jgi:hypothetical protein
MYYLSIIKYENALDVFNNNNDCIFTLMGFLYFTSLMSILYRILYLQEKQQYFVLYQML